MKKIIIWISILMLFVFSSVCLGAGGDKSIYTYTILNAGAITGSGNTTTSPINTAYLQLEGYFSFKITTVGAGSAVTIEYQVSHDGTNYYEPATASDIATNVIPGTYVYSFSPPVAPYIRLKITETNGAAVTSCTIVMSAQ